MTKFRTIQPDRLVQPMYRHDIDGLRAIAVLSVVGFHAFPSLVLGGFVGVDVFFVISGFLISTIIFRDLERGTFGFQDFYARRVRRIFPALVLVLTACFAFGWIALLPREYKELGRHITAGAGFFSNFMLWKEAGYFDASAEHKPLLHLWSLGIEEQFYIVWPIFLYLAWKKRFNLLLVSVVIAACSFLFNVSQIHKDSIGTFYSPAARAWELLVGSAIAHVYVFKSEFLRKQSHRLDAALCRIIRPGVSAPIGQTLRDRMAALGFILIVASVFGLTKGYPFPGWWAVLPVIGALLVISAGPDAWFNRVVLSSRVAVSVGLISYPLYLWHWPLLSFAHIMEQGVPSWRLRIAAVLTAVFLAWITAKFIERPMRFCGNGSVKTGTLCLLIATVGGIGYYADLRDGLGFRFSNEIQPLLNFQYDYGNSYRARTCFLSPEQDESAFKDCTDKPKAGVKTSILWGDSHAAHLYSGLNKVFGNEFRFTQLTASACPPILNVEIKAKPHCKRINDYVLSRIIKEIPDRVILAAIWSSYDWKALARTIEQLHAAGVRSIDVVGPVPQWKDRLPNVLVNLYRRDLLIRSVPQRTRFGLIPTIGEVDESMQALVTQNKANYISALKIFCNEDGCLTRTNESLTSLVAWDSEHLTATGSEYLVSHFPRFPSPIVTSSPD